MAEKDALAEGARRLAFAVDGDHAVRVAQVLLQITVDEREFVGDGSGRAERWRRRVAEVGNVGDVAGDRVVVVGVVFVDAMKVACGAVEAKSGEAAVALDRRRPLDAEARGGCEALSAWRRLLAGRTLERRHATRTSATRAADRRARLVHERVVGVGAQVGRVTVLATRVRVDQLELMIVK